MATTYVGTIGEFESTKEKFTSYIERVNLFLDANSIPEEKKVSTLLTLIGPESYQILRSLLSPALPKDKTFEELVTVLKGHFEPRALIIAERFRFYCGFKNLPNPWQNSLLRSEDFLLLVTSGTFSIKH